MKRPSSRPDDGEINLMAAVLWRVPRLAGAACRDHRETFDRANGSGQGRRHSASFRRARAEAKAVCGTCPALAGLPRLGRRVAAL